MNDSVDAFLDVSHVLQYLVDFHFIKLKTHKLRVLRETREEGHFISTHSLCPCIDFKQTVGLLISNSDDVVM